MIRRKVTAFFNFDISKYECKKCFKVSEISFFLLMLNCGFLCHCQNHHKASRFHLDIPLINFDYHTECKGGNLRNLEKLRTQLMKYLDKFEYFFWENDEVKR